MDYNKHKDRKPENTIKKIKGILDDLKIKTEVDWGENPLEGCFSNRISIKDTLIGTNGKGTTETYCMASAYGELMERLQCNCFYLGKQNPKDRDEYGFAFDPLEKDVSILECCKMDNIFFSNLFEMCGADSVNDRKKLLQTWDMNDIGSLKLMPCVSLAEKNIQYIPFVVDILFYGSNGMCAGNTTEEALVQGMAEIFERYVTRQIIINGITPPTIDNNIIENIPTLNNVKKQIEESGRFEVIAKDCSLGMGIPVVGVIVIDHQTGKFGLKFASHLSLAVALERCFTEAMQGKNIEEYANMCNIGTEQQVLHRDNIYNHFKIGHAYFFPDLLFSKADYPCSLDHFEDSLNNMEMLRVMLDTGMKLSDDILIKDNSFLGIPAYKIIVPGISEICSIDDILLKELNTLQKITSSLENSKNLNEIDLERIIRYIRFKQYSAIEREIAYITGKPIYKLFSNLTNSTDFLEAICLLDLGRKKEAMLILAGLKQNAYAMKNYDEALYFGCIIKFLNTGSSDALNVLFGKDLAEKVRYEFGEEGKITSKLMPEFDCWDCGSCKSANNICLYPKTCEVILKIKKKRKEAGITQNELLGFLDANI